MARQTQQLWTLVKHINQLLIKCIEIAHVTTVTNLSVDIQVPHICFLSHTHADPSNA